MYHSHNVFDQFSKPVLSNSFRGFHFRVGWLPWYHSTMKVYDELDWGFWADKEFHLRWDFGERYLVFEVFLCWTLNLCLHHPKWHFHQKCRKLSKISTKKYLIIYLLIFGNWVKNQIFIKLWIFARFFCWFSNMSEQMTWERHKLWLRKCFRAI